MKGYKPGYIIKAITLDDILKAQPEKVYYSVRTCWWTHRKEDLCVQPETGLPCDPRGSVVCETRSVVGFIQTASRDVRRFGKYGMRTFEAAHAMNCMVAPDDLRSTGFQTWREYQDAIGRTDAYDAMLARKAGR